MASVCLLVSPVGVVCSKTGITLITATAFDSKTFDLLLLGKHLKIIENKITKHHFIANKGDRITHFGLMLGKFFLGNYLVGFQGRRSPHACVTVSGYSSVFGRRFVCRFFSVQKSPFTQRETMESHYHFELAQFCLE